MTGPGLGLIIIVTQLATRVFISDHGLFLFFCFLRQFVLYTGITSSALAPTPLRFTIVIFGVVGLGLSGFATFRPAESLLLWPIAVLARCVVAVRVVAL